MKPGSKVEIVDTDMVNCSNIPFQGLLGTVTAKARADFYGRVCDEAYLCVIQVAAEIHSVCRGYASECASCPHRLDDRKLGERMLEHVACAEWETTWSVADEMSTHEEIYCRPCPHWGKGKP